MGVDYDDDVLTEELEDVVTITDKANILVLFNDDYHTFDYVIDALVEICKHSSYQAEQCAYITHTKGKCDIKHGSYSFLSPMKDALIDRELTVEIQ